MHKDLWPVRPNPIPDETFTSWSARLAIGNGLPPRTFFVQALGWNDVWRKDFDLFDDPEKLAFLVKKTGKNLQTLVDMKLDPQTLPVNASGYLDSHEFTHFCPDCLLEDKDPYFRKDWRSSQIATCRHHKTFLHSRCSHCFSPVRLLECAEVTDLSHCGACKAPLAVDVKKVQAPDHLLAYTSNISAAFNGHGFLLGENHDVSPWLFLQGLPVLAEIVCMREVWGKVYDHIGVSAFFAKPLNLFFNQRESFVDRCVLLLILSWILAEWPSRFSWAVSDLPPGSFKYLTTNSDIPFWLWQAIKECFDVPAADYCSVDESVEITRLISHGTISESDYYRMFGRHHYLRINGRNLKNFRRIHKEAVKLHASTYS